jgi:hypothetical protein
MRKINYGASPGLGQSSKKGNGINEGLSRVGIVFMP